MTTDATSDKLAATTRISKTADASTQVKTSRKKTPGKTTTNNKTAAAKTAAKVVSEPAKPVNATIKRQKASQTALGRHGCRVWPD